MRLAFNDCFGFNEHKVFEVVSVEEVHSLNTIEVNNALVALYKYEDNKYKYIYILCEDADTLYDVYSEIVNRGVVNLEDYRSSCFATNRSSYEARKAMLELAKKEWGVNKDENNV